MYRLLFERVLSRLDAETVHRASFALLRCVMAIPFMRVLSRALLAPRIAALEVEALGTRFASPLGLAAGFDKDAEGYEALYALGFGFVEIGTVTGQAQPGNPRPRLFRLVGDQALINRLGFNNQGAEEVAPRLSRPRAFPLGVNLGKTKLVPEEQAASDYVRGARLLGPHADYVVVNVSSPNTPGLRDLQAVERLRPLLSQVREALDEASPQRRVPLLVKIAPDLSDPDIDAVADMALSLGLDGIVATNTTVARTGLRSDPQQVAALGAGGLSGAPLKARSLEVLRRLYQRVGDRLPLIGVGGIMSAEDALERILAGATLVQAYTGFIYGGPLWPGRLQKQLAALLRARGFARARDAVGAATVRGDQERRTSSQHL